MSAVDGMIKPGWYWFHYGSAEAPDVDRFIRTTPQMRVRVTFRGHTSAAQVIVFEALAPFRWTLGGYPTVARKKSATRIEDLASGPPPSPGLLQLIEEITGKTYDEVRKSAQGASAAFRVVVYGGAAILLINWFRSTAPAVDLEDDAA